MVSRQNALDILNNLKQDPENLKCFECGSDFPTFASVNNGCFICAVCVPSHTVLGESVSRAKEIESDWSEEELRLMIAGGNSSLREFFTHYNLINTPINFKYLTKASFFYRDMLHVVSQDREYEHPCPELDQGVQLMVGNYPELGQVPEEVKMPCEGTVHSSEVTVQPGEVSVQPEQKKGAWAWAKKAYLKTVDFGNKATDLMSEKLNKLSEESSLVRKFEDTTIKVVGYVEKGLNKAVDKVYSKPEVQNAIGQVNHAANSLGQEVKITYQKINSNPSVQKLKEDTMNMLREIKASLSSSGTN